MGCILHEFNCTILLDTVLQTVVLQQTLKDKQFNLNLPIPRKLYIRVLQPWYVFVRTVPYVARGLQSVDSGCVLKLMIISTLAYLEFFPTFRLRLIIIIRNIRNYLPYIVINSNCEMPKNVMYDLNQKLYNLYIVHKAPSPVASTALI